MLEEFQSFVDQAQVLRSRRTDTPGVDFHAMIHFLEFAEQSETLLARSVVHALPAWGELGRLVAWNVPSVDLLDIAGLSRGEDAYTELVAWMLRDEWDPESTLVRQNALLRCLAPDAVALPLDAPAQVHTQVFTDDGIPDLVLLHDAFAVAVEAKTGSVEHPTPSGKMQTLAYGPAVRRTFRLPEPLPVHVAFLTSDGSRPANPSASRCTWVGLAMAMTRALAGIRLDRDLHCAAWGIIGHLLGHGAPSLNALELLSATSGARTNERGLDIVQNLPDLVHLLQLEHPGRLDEDDTHV